MKKINTYNKNLKSKSKYLRKNPTKAETYLWKFVLSKGQLNGYKFKRQRPMDKYIVDFFCEELKLIIETDGFSHIGKQDKDDIRIKNLKNLGFNVIRFSDNDVTDNLDGVITTLSKLTEINSLKQTN